MHGPGHSYPAFPGMRYEVGKILGYEVWRRTNKLMFPLKHVFRLSPSQIFVEYGYELGSRDQYMAGYEV